MSRSNFSLPGVIDTPSEATWDDLVFPKHCIQSLHEYVLWVTHRDQVELEWGGRVTGGPIALFSGAVWYRQNLYGQIAGEYPWT